MRKQLHKQHSVPAAPHQSVIKRKVRPKLKKEDRGTGSEGLLQLKAQNTQATADQNVYASNQFGGEVTNSTNVSWLISGGSNSSEQDFNWLPPNTNSDNMQWVRDQLKGDVDAVWPAGKELKNISTGKIVTSGAFKLRDHRNTNIDKENKGYVIYDFSKYFSSDNLPPGWKLPAKFNQ